MRLLQLGAEGELIVARDIGYNIPPYAILSHTWGNELDDEVTLQDINENKGKEKPGYQKIVFCGQQAKRDDLEHFWVDTCCIDKTSFFELTEAINSMFRWYQNAQKCYVYLADVSKSDREADELARSTWKLAFRKSKWFTRGWTLQELIAPRIVEFFSSDCQRLGNKQSLAEMIRQITRIPPNALQGVSLAQFGIEERISWSKGRTTKRGEDKAYSLLGILDVSMDSAYGEGETKALERLRAILLSRSMPGVLKQLPVAFGAAYDSHAEEHNQQCLPGTRTEIITKIAEWAHDPSSKTVYWLNGMAGTGKSTISRTLARHFAKSNTLGATFFFKRGEGDVGRISKFFTTIVSQLIRRWPEMAEYVQAVIKKDPDIGSIAMSEQFHKLIIGPLSRISLDTKQRRPCLIIVDALDECEPQGDVKSLINLLSSTEPWNGLHLKFFLTSRPERLIREGFQAAKGTHEEFILHDVAQSAIEHDLTAYLKYELGKIREGFNQNGHDQLPASWPSQTDLETLVRIAAPLFISAAIISRFIADSQLGNPEEQLEKVVNYEASNEFASEVTPISVLHSIISNGKVSTTGDDVNAITNFKTFVGSIIVLANPLSLCALAMLLDCQTSEIDATLSTLHSVLNVPEDPEQPIRLFHLSYRDFLVNPPRRHDRFRIDEKETHKKLASHCLRVLENALRTDICKVTAPGTPVSSIHEADINTHISPGLQYACRFWVYHLQESLLPESRLVTSETTKIWHFLKKHFLQWLEALSWMRRLSDSFPMIKSLHSIIPRGECPDLDDFINDSFRFVQTMSSCIQKNPLQVYSSSLIFSPRSSIIRKCFEENMSSRFALIPRMPSHWTKRLATHWTKRLATLEGHHDEINSVTFSPDGQQVASGSQDNTVILWDVNTGERRRTLMGNMHSVDLVAFSPDGRWVASASRDQTVILWAANTGERLSTSGKYSSPVYSVVFSPDNKLMAIALQDGDILLERAGRHERWQTLKGHSDSVQSVVFSPDSKLLASASEDGTIMIWVTETGERRQILKGHSKDASLVTFSPDGRLLLSASISDGPAILWVVETGELRQTFHGPRAPYSIAFSPDGKPVALASEDDTMMLWAMDTGVCKRMFAHYSFNNTSVAFSPDATLIASASEDNAVIIWAADMNEAEQENEEQSSRLRLIMFSPDGTMVASTNDKTVTLWDSNTGERRQVLEGHSNSIKTIEFWPNGKLLTTIALDGIGITWETDTGERRYTFQALEPGIVFSPNGELVACRSNTLYPSIWATDTGDFRQTLKSVIHSWRSSSWPIAFSHSGQRVAWGSYDKIVYICIVGMSEPWQRLEGHTAMIHSVTFSPDDQLVASASEDGTIIIWDVDTGGRRQTLKGPSSYTRLIAFSPDGNLVASTSNDEDKETVVIWAINTGQCQETFELGTTIHRLRFDDSSEHIITDVGAFAIGNTTGPSSVRTSNLSISTMPSPPTGTSHVGYGISQDRCWLTLHGESFLWLPQEYRPETWAILGSTIAIYCPSGRVLIFRLS